MVPYEGLQSSPAWGNNVYGVEGLQDEYGIEGFARPNILQLEQEDEDYDDEHPTGFRRANEADLAERAGQPPDNSFVLPTRRHAEFDARFFGANSHNVLHIARKTGTHISMPVDMSEPVLWMWGTADRLLSARRDLHALMEQVQNDLEHGARRSSLWVKIRAMPTDKKQQMIDNMIKEARVRKMYRLPPPTGISFPAVGIFIWPAKERSPQQILGLACEALDDIRFDQKVWILFNRKGNMFRVLGDDPRDVDIAVSRIRGVFCEVAAKRRRPTKMVLLHPPSVNLSATKIVANENHDLINRQVTVKRLEANKGIQMLLGGPAPNLKFLQSWKIKSEILTRANDTYMRKALEQGIQDLTYFLGHARIRVYIGKMVLYGYRRARENTYDILDFGAMVRNSQTDGELIRSIGSGRYGIKDNEVADELRQYCDRIFTPMDTNPDHRSEGPVVEPQISATFELKLYDEQGAAQDIRLEVTYERLPGKREYRPLDRRWLNTRDKESRPNADNPRKGPVNIKVIDVQADLGYQIEIVTWSLYRETHYPIFQEFSRALGIEYIPDEFTAAPLPELGQPDTRPTIPRITFVNLPGMSVSGVVQKTKYRYYLPRTSYVFELTRYEHLPIHPVSTLYPDGVPISYRGLDTPFDTRWGCAIWHKRWDQYLSQQAVAQLGQRGDWDPDIEKFFPSSSAQPATDSDAETVKDGRQREHVPDEYNDDGFAEFLDTVRQVVRLVKSAQENVARQKMTQVEAWTGGQAVVY
ncbi:hypothetical protein BZA05DRAFT_369117 [Tricharina praecox]|uniref:uncharacterized protein n=1 Tax=Tricharina praecox TaxID=43433 RepID=UPI00221E55C7|nr:uncharacterized protein BZA05DRAFT_369117 [Tricharina praecox]KAI5855633.1 hypothetical protein BZA05DRAFT_369117 [Tricharina praecox]